MNKHSAFAVGAPRFVDPLSLMADPHAALAALRSAHPVIQIDEGLFLALRAHDVIGLLTHPSTKQVEGMDYVRLNRVPAGVTAELLEEFFLFSNGEAHRARRGLFAKAFAHGAMKELRDEVRAVADRIVADAPRGEPFDFVDHVAARVPAEMIAAILGLPREEAPYFTARVYQLARAVSPIYPLEEHEEIEAAAAGLFAYVDAHLRARLETPKDDLLSRLVASWRENPTINFPSLVYQVLGVIVGGSDTTRAAFAMLVSLLLRHPEQWAAVKRDPDLIPGAVSEAMRFEPSVGTMPRFTTAPLEIDGVLLPAGVILSVSTLSAMRDPALYADPDRFDIRRDDHPRLHPVFGGGPHRCLGEMLARIEMEEALSALIAAAPEIEMEAAPRMIGFGGIRQITPMMVRVS